MKPIFEKVPITNNNSFFIKTEDFNTFDVPWHVHPEFELYYIIKGHGKKIVGDSVSLLEEGEVGIVGPNLPHLWHSDSKNDNELVSKQIIVQFLPQFLGETFFELPEMNRIKSLLSDSVYGIVFFGNTREYARKMIHQIISQTGAESLLSLLKLLYALSISEEREYLTVNPSVSYAGHDADRMNKIFNYMMNNFRNEISLSTIAEKANLTPEAFCRYFRKRTKKTYSQFLGEIRIEHTCKLLRTSTMTVSEISVHCGYNNLSNFNRQFKKVTNFTPGEFRNLMTK